MMLSKPIGGQNMWVLRRRYLGVGVAGDIPDERRWVTLLFVDRVDHRRFVRLVVSRQWAVHQAVGHVEPGFAVRLHDEGRGAVVVVQADAVWLCRRVRRLGDSEIGYIETDPALLARIPVDIAAHPRPAGCGELLHQPRFLGPGIALYV